MESLPKSERLTTSEINHVFSKGKKIWHQPVSLLYLPINHDDQTNRVAFAVSKKVSKKATVRNYSKRLMREVYRKNKALFPGAYHFVFLQHCYFEELSFQTLLTIFRTLSEKLKAA